jgi:NAD(P)-dependent dehydrogenase (short-subunit alcohol dehydrogenase family)
MGFDFAGKTVWITGASSGIGEAMAIEAARRGARLVLTSRRKPALEAVAAACARAAEASGSGAPTANVLEADLSDPAARAAACDAVLRSGGVDVAVLNAGVSQRSSFLETPPGTFAAIMEVDFEAPVDMTRRLLPSMLERGSGALVAVSSLLGLAGAPLRPAYSAAKHALAGLFQSLRSELIGTGIRIVTAFPGYVRTPIDRAALGPDGEPMGIDDPHISGGADPGRVARRILDAALRGPVERKLALGPKLRLGLFLSRRIPSLWASMSARHVGILGKSGKQGTKAPTAAPDTQAKE